MAELVANCPRCKAQRITFDVKDIHFTGRTEHGWQHWHEAFSICRACGVSTVFVLTNRQTNRSPANADDLVAIRASLNNFMRIERYINIGDNARLAPPEHVPKNIANVFKEGATCLAVECWNAAGTMFRLCVDLATKPLLPEQVEGQPEPNGLSRNVRRSLGLRLNWLFENGGLPDGLRSLSACIKDDGNDGAHDGTLTKEDAADLLDFTETLLERLYTEPKKLELAEARREQRRTRQ